MTRQSCQGRSEVFFNRPKEWIRHITCELATVAPFDFGKPLFCDVWRAVSTPQSSPDPALTGSALT